MDRDKSKNLLKELYNFNRTKGVTTRIIPDSELPRESNSEVEVDIIIPYISYNFKVEEYDGIKSQRKRRK